MKMTTGVLSINLLPVRIRGTNYGSSYGRCIPTMDIGQVPQVQDIV